MYWHVQDLYVECCTLLNELAKTYYVRLIVV